MTNPPPQATATELLPEISDAMIEAGGEVFGRPNEYPNVRDYLSAIYLAMNAARPNQEATRTVGDGEVKLVTCLANDIEYGTIATGLGRIEIVAALRALLTKATRP